MSKRKTPFDEACETKKPRLLFILLGIRNENMLKYIQPALNEHIPPEKIFYYKVWEHSFNLTLNYYESWFTDVMIKKGSYEVVVVLHDENMDIMAETFDRRMKAFHSTYNYMVVKCEFRKPYEMIDPDEEELKEPVKIPTHFWEYFANEMSHYYHDTCTGNLSTLKEFTCDEKILEEIKELN